MTDQTKDTIGYKILTAFGGKIIGFSILLFVIGLIGFLFDSFKFQEYCSNSQSNNIEEKNLSDDDNILLTLEDESTRKNTLCHFLQLYTFIYSSLITSAITICVIEIFLRKDFALELKKDLFNMSEIQEVNGLVKKVYRDIYEKKNEYEKEIVKLIKDAEAGDEIRLIGLNKEVYLLRQITASLIESKVKNKVKFKILVLDPESSLTDSIKNSLKEKVNKNKNNKENYQTDKYLPGDFNILKELKDKLRGDFNHDNKFEVKVKKDIYSPVCYFSIKHYKNKGLSRDKKYLRKFKAFVWIYIFDQEGNIKCPGLKFSSKKFLEDTETHFDSLWANSSDYFSESSSESLRKSSDYFSESSSESLRKSTSISIE